MGLFDSVLKEPVAGLVKAARQEWKGLLIGIGMGLIYWFFVLRPVINKYHDLGTYVGNYKVQKGSTVTIARNELWIKYINDIYGSDSTFLLPEFQMPSADRNYRFFPTFDVGQRLGFDGQYFYYTIELTKLETGSTDTVAHFDVHRREYPENLKKAP